MWCFCRVLGGCSVLSDTIPPGTLLRGRRSGHRYVLEATLGRTRRVFRARDEKGRLYAVRLALAGQDVAQQAAWSVLCPRLFPELLELDEAYLRGEGSINFLVQEFISGYTLFDLEREGRYLIGGELQALGQGLRQTAENLLPMTGGQYAFTPEGVIYDIQKAYWRLLSLAAPKHPDARPDQWSMGFLLWTAGGGELGARPKFGHETLPACVEARPLVSRRPDRLNPPWLVTFVAVVCVVFVLGVLVHFG